MFFVDIILQNSYAMIKKSFLDRYQLLNTDLAFDLIIIVFYFDVRNDICRREFWTLCWTNQNLPCSLLRNHLTEQAVKTEHTIF